MPLANLTHTVMWNTCAQSLVQQFVADPRGMLDTRCAADWPAPDFDYSPQSSLQWLGTADAWENN